MAIPVQTHWQIHFLYCLILGIWHTNARPRPINMYRTNVYQYQEFKFIVHKGDLKNNRIIISVVS